jgi:cation:H+ antiporter
MCISVLTDIILIGLGFALLVKGSDYFVAGAAQIAKKVGVSELVIGLTLVSASTTLPEFMASTTASYLGSSGIAVGNAVGSDITNIALILGVCMIIREYSIQRDVFNRYGSALLVVCVLFCGILPHGISRVDGLVLVAVFPVYIWFTVRKDIANDRVPAQIPDTPVIKLILAFGGGIAAIFIGARFLVESSMNIAEVLQVHESAIGSTIVALGTSLPEFAVSVRAVTKNHGYMSVGNILGANTLNLVWVTGASALINPLTLDRNLLYINVPVMLVVTGLLLVFMRMGTLKRWHGIVFVVLYAVFVGSNFG